MNNEKNIEGLAIDKWIDSIPGDPYQLCPCGCNQKWRFVVKAGESELLKHEQFFIQNIMKGINHDNSNY